MLLDPRDVLEQCQGRGRSETGGQGGYVSKSKVLVGKLGQQGETLNCSGNLTKAETLTHFFFFFFKHGS